MKHLNDMTNILDKSGLFNLYISLSIVNNSYVEECKKEKQTEVLEKRDIVFIIFQYHLQGYWS